MEPKVKDNPVKKQRCKYPGLRGWTKCKGDKYLRPQSKVLEKRSEMRHKLGGCRLWTLLFVILSGSFPVAADLCSAEDGTSHGLGLMGYRVRSTDILDRGKHSLHPNLSFSLGNASSTLVDGIPFVNLDGCNIGFASPPCQKFSTMKHAAGADVVSKELNLIPDVREAFIKAGIPYCIENVLGAGPELINPIGLCGTMFGLNVSRHRLFECNFALKHELECDHLGFCLGEHSRMPKLDKYGNRRNCCHGNLFPCYGSPGGKVGSVAEWSDAMACYHMSAKGLSLSLPPMYGQYMGALGLKHLVMQQLEARGWNADWVMDVSVFEPQIVNDWLQAQLRAENYLGVSSANLANDYIWSDLYFSKAGPVAQVHPQEFAETLPMNRYPQPSLMDVERGLFSQVWYCVNDKEIKEAVKCIEKLCKGNPWSRCVIWTNFRPKLLPSWNLSPVDLMCKQHLAFSTKTHTWLPRLVDSSEWPIPLPKEEVPEDVAKARKAQKYIPVNLNHGMFLSLGFSQEVCDIVDSIPIYYLGDRETFQEVDQYPWVDRKDDKGDTVDVKQGAIDEVERGLSCGALIPCPADIQVKLVHPLVVVFKGNRTRVCVDYSVLLNDWCPKIPFELPQYLDVEKFVTPGCWMAKFDLRDFFWNFKVKQEDWSLMGLRHPKTNELLLHVRLPFGYTDSPRMCCTVSEAVAEYCRSKLEISCLAFVDDFWLCAETKEECWEAMLKFEALVSDLGFDIAPHKTEGPVQKLTFLGVEIDSHTHEMCFRLPAEKMQRMKTLLDMAGDWQLQGRKTVKAKELAELVGFLVFASRVIPGSNLFLRNLWDCLSVAHLDKIGRPWVRWGNQNLQLGFKVWEDLDWWRLFACTRNRWAMKSPNPVNLTLDIASDASTTGGGIVFEFPFNREEFAVVWNSYECMQHINWLEMLMVWWGLMQYKHLMFGMTIQFAIDNLVTVLCLKKGGSRSKVLMELVKRIWLTCILNNIRLVPWHIPGIENVKPDGLSRGCRPTLPGVRLKSCWFDYCKELWNTLAFDWVFGKECEHQQSSLPGLEVTMEGSCAFIHPRFDCVAECLKWCHEAMRKDPLHTRICLILPCNPDAIWWPMLQKFQVLRRISSFLAPLEYHKHGMWRDLQGKYDSLICAYPFLVGGNCPKGFIQTSVPSFYQSVKAGASNCLVDVDSVLAKVADCTFLFDMFDEDRKQRLHETVGKDGLTTYQYGDLYAFEEFDMQDSEHTVILRWFRKQAPYNKSNLATHKFAVTTNLYRITVQEIAKMFDVTHFVNAQGMKEKIVSKRKVDFDAGNFVSRQFKTQPSSRLAPLGEKHNEWVLPEDMSDVASIVTGEVQEWMVFSNNDGFDLTGDQSSSSSLTGFASPPNISSEVPSSNNHDHGAMGEACISSEPAALSTKSNLIGNTLPLATGDDSSRALGESQTSKPPRVVRFEALFSEARMEVVIMCWSGKCGKSVQKDIFCPKCSRVAHSSCLGLDPLISTTLPSGMCPDCVMASINVNVSEEEAFSPLNISEELALDLGRLSLSSMGENRTTSVSKGVKMLLSAVNRYEESRQIKIKHLTLDTPELFACLLRFVGQEEAHPASMSTHMTAISHVLASRGLLGVEDWSKGELVQKEYIALKKNLFFEPHDGQPLPWQVTIHAVKYVEFIYKTSILLSRLKIGHFLLSLGGERATEVCEHGDKHGISAPNVIVAAVDGFTWPDGTSTPAGDLVNPMGMHAVNMWLFDSKTETGKQLVTVASPTYSGMNLYAALMECTQQWGMVWRDTTIEGKPAKFIDYYVIRVDLGSLDPASPQGRKLASAVTLAIKYIGYKPNIEKYYVNSIMSRWNLKDSNQHFLNFAGGTLAEMFQLYEGINQMLIDTGDFGDANAVVQLQMSVIEGPLVRKTEARNWRCHMPLSYTTFANGVVDLWKYTEKEEMGDNTLRLVTQSGRHGCCYRARALIDKTGVANHKVDELIERHFRWKPDIGKMRKRYAGIMDMFDRMMVTILF